MALRYWAIRGDVAHFTSAVYKLPLSPHSHLPTLPTEAGRRLLSIQHFR